MKTTLALIAVAALVLQSSCSSPGSASKDPMRNAMGYAAQGQMAAHQQASLARAGMLQPGRVGVAPMQAPAFPSFQPFAQ